MNGLPGAVLFACNFNRVRSPMAEALLKMGYGDRVFVDSVGLRREPGEKEVDPFAAAVIDEIGGDLAGFRPKVFDDLEDESFDLVISLTPEAQHRAVELAIAVLRRPAVGRDIRCVVDQGGRHHAGLQRRHGV